MRWKQSNEGKARKPPMRRLLLPQFLHLFLTNDNSYAVKRIFYHLSTVSSRQLACGEAPFLSSIYSQFR